MMLAIAIFKALVAALISLAAWTMERGFEKQAWPRRWLWLGAIVLTCAVPALTILRDCTLTIDVQNRPIPANSVENPGAGVIGRFRADYQEVLVRRPQLDGYFDDAARAVRLIGFAALALAWFAQRALLKGKPATIDGTGVLMSARTGPAVVGFFKPAILVPEWFLGLPRPVRELALAHERSHIAARDPWCLFALLLFIAATADVATIAFLVWQFRRFRFAVEVDCDHRVAAKAGVQEYAQALLAVAQRRCGLLVGAIALVERTPELERRIGVMIARSERPFSRHAQIPIATAIVLVAAAALLDAPLKPYPRLVQWIHSHREIAVAPEVLAGYAGRYAAGDAAAEFTARGNRLVAVTAADFGPIMPGDGFAPIGAGDFVLVTPPRRTIRLTFVRSPAGLPATLLENVRGETLALHRASVDGGVR
jgi:hypothetical protein